MKNFNKIWEILQEAFPPDERRSKEDQASLLKQKDYYIAPYYEGADLIGFLCYWDLREYVFIEHLAVEGRYRGEGYGRRMMENLLTDTKKKVILEVEYPENETSKGRIRFYEKLGFKLNTMKYLQPSYGGGKEAVPLLLMTYPEFLTELKAEEIIQEIYRNVYDLNQ